MMNRVWLGIRVAAPAALALVAACSSGDVVARASAADTSGEAPVRVVTVEVMEAVPESFTDGVTLTGNVEADRDVIVSAEEGGVIREILVDKGRRVSAGQPLLRIDAQILQAQLDQLSAEARLAEETWQRQRKLW